ncbi:hypothetical protein [Streptomyces sp. NPDC051079]|uniref:hypothetical protein n=1 Tax=Streptomyces sp. NPDC051079 TaxID=3155043 RepID=UPI00344C33B5
MAQARAASAVVPSSTPCSPLVTAARSPSRTGAGRAAAWAGGRSVADVKEQGWEDADETRRGLAPQMSYLLGTGRYPTYRAYALGAARKDDAGRLFETGLRCVLDGVAGLVERGGE